MPSTYSALARLELMAFNEKANLWGPITNTNLTLLEAALDGSVTVAVPDADVTLTTVDAAPDQARNRAITFTGTLTVTRTITIPAVSRLYYFFNNTTGSLTYKTSAGAGVTFPTGSRAWVYCDGTDTVEALQYARLTGGSVANATLLGTTLAGDFTRGGNSILGYAPNITGSNYTIVDGDRKRMVYRTGSGSMTLTIPTNATTAFPLGSEVLFAVDALAAAATVSPASGVTLRTVGTTTTGAITVNPRDLVRLIKTGTDEWWAMPSGSGGALLASNNLSDLSNAATARTNLGLGTAATQNTGTTGATVPLLNGINTHTDARGVNAASTADLQFGFRRMRPASVAVGTPVAADGDSLIRAVGNITAPAGVFTAGDTFTVYNANNAVINLLAGAGLTLRLGGSTATGTRTVAPRGVATVIYDTASEAVVVGNVT